MYRNTYAEIYKFIRYRVTDRELAKDVLQETFYIAYKKWDTVRELSNPTGWLINVAKNKIRELNKTLKKLECEVPLEADEYTVNEEGFKKSELDILLMGNLTDEEKTRFIRYFIRGCTISEMAKYEDISENNMSVRISRLRDKIARNISDENFFDKNRKESVRNDKKTPCT